MRIKDNVKSVYTQIMSYVKYSIFRFYLYLSIFQCRYRLCIISAV